MTRFYQVYLYRDGKKHPCSACYKLTKHYMYAESGSFEPDICCKKCYKKSFVSPVPYGAFPDYKQTINEYHWKFAKKWNRHKKRMSEHPKTKIRKAMAMLRGDCFHGN